MQSSVARWGNSLALRIPKPVADALALGEGMRVEIEAEGGRLVARPLATPPTLDELLAAITPENLPIEGFDDGSIGLEAL